MPWKRSWGPGRTGSTQAVPGGPHLCMCIGLGSYPAVVVLGADVVLVAIEVAPQVRLQNQII